MGLIIENKETLVRLGEMSMEVYIGLFGLLVIGILEIRKIKGSILIGIVISTIISIIFGLVSVPESFVSIPPSIAPIAFQLNILEALHISLWGAIFSFMFVDLFDSVGTIIACSHTAGLTKSDGTIPGLQRILESDAFATSVGALLGTSTTTTYIESATGIANGARTGFSSVVTGLLFIVVIFFTPIIGLVPGYVTAPALIVVGVYMFRSIREIDFMDFIEGVPAFLTIILMPLTNSISTGLTFGFISYVLLAMLSGQHKRISLIMWIIGILAGLNVIMGLV